ncbi:hypothetical protein F5148DRAFT_11522 [Russula earlei]|uniref:Uncharacterized protein n=1 Tax=Russula earlei TaxID=71964 RepID=A0ACC0UR22_9AGAM|nr:hypothetical protein F5148DRAFT_11522 [Russula earlei]
MHTNKSSFTLVLFICIRTLLLKKPFPKIPREDFYGSFLTFLAHSLPSQRWCCLNNVSPSRPHPRTLHITLLGARIEGHFTPAFPIWSIEELRRGLELDKAFEGFKAHLAQCLKSWPPPACPTDANPIHYHLAHIRSLHGDNPPELEKAIDDILDNAVKYFGYVARDVFRAILRNFQRVYEGLMSTLGNPQQFEDILRAVVSGENFSTNHPSHRAIVINSRRKIGHPVSWDIDFRSDWITKAAALKIQECADEHVCEIMSDLASFRQGATLASWLFEVYAHRTIVRDAKDLRQRDHV